MRSILKIFIWLTSAVLVLVLLAGGYLWYEWSSNLPYIGTLKEYRPPIITEIYSDDGEVIGRFWDERRIVVGLDEIPDHLIKAFVAAEDARFFEHEGLDVLSIFRAFYKNVTAGRIEQGGSTITQQMVRSLLLKNTRRTYRRKVREAILSIQFEKNFSKDQILYLYLNEIYLGQGAYGVESAARTYFGKSAKDLTVAQSALLAGLPQAPARYSPVSHFNRAKARQKYVLQRMFQEGFIDREKLDKALAEDIIVRYDPENTFLKAPYFTETIRQYLMEKYGRERLQRGGLKVYTPLDLRMQHVAQDALKRGLSDLDKREGYRGPVTHLAPDQIEARKTDLLEKWETDPPTVDAVVQGIVEEVDDKKNEAVVWMGKGRGRLPLSKMKWATKPNSKVAYYARKLKKISDALKVNDVVLVRILKEGESPFAWELALEQEVLAQGALLCLEPETGEIEALVGGRSFKHSQFNRALQSRRQPGSAFKPIIYAAALDKSMTPASIILDSPYISEEKNQDEAWKPKNYKEKFFGPTLFRTGLIKSRNVITVKILDEIGINTAVEYAKKMGIVSDLSPDLSLALGSSGVSLLELTRSYGVFANGGYLIKPIFIKKIIDRSGQVIEENQPVLKKALSKETSYVMTDLLKSVIKEGTGWRIKALKRPAAGKTGTTNNLLDAWFLGYTPGLVTGVWVGYDDLKAMGRGETGSRAASPIWLDFMSKALDGKPVVDFKVPPGIVFAKIDAKTGLLAGPHSKKSVFQAFKEGRAPKEYSPKPKAPKSGQFLQYDMDQAQ